MSKSAFFLPGITIMNDLPGIDDQGNFVEGVGVTEWKGWSFADKDWWVQAAGDQRRSEFELGEGAVAIEMGATVHDLGAIVHPHPTLSETLMEGAEVFFGHSTHVFTKKRAH